MEDKKPTITEKLKGAVSSIFGMRKMESDSVGVKFTTQREALGKIFTLMVELEEERKLRSEIDEKYNQLHQMQLNRRNDEIIKALTGREIKKVIKKKTKETEKEPAKKEEKTKAETPKKKTKKGETATSVPKTKPKVSAPPAPAAPAPTTATRSVTPAIVGGALTGIASISIAGETGAKTTSEAIQKGGQIVPNDPEPGAFSYGIFGMNSKAKTADAFVQQYPQFGIRGKSGTKEFNESWSKAAKEKPKELYDAQLDWYNKNIIKPLQKDLSVQLPSRFSSDGRILAYFSDRRVQYGRTMEKQAIEYSVSANTPEQFIERMTDFDLKNIGTAFKTYLSTHKDDEKGLRNRIMKRKERALQIEPNLSGTTIQSLSQENKHYKDEMNESKPQVTNQYNNVSQSSTVVTPRTEKFDDRPAILRKG